MKTNHHRLLTLAHILLWTATIQIVARAAQAPTSEKDPQNMTPVEQQAEINELEANRARIEQRLKVLGRNTPIGATTFFHGGLRLLSPFSIDWEKDASGKKTGRAFLKEGDGATSGFLEFVYSNRWAWNELRLLDNKPKDRLGILQQPLSAANWDFDSRLTYNFAKGSENDPSAIVGSGDFGLEVTTTGHIFSSLFVDGDIDRGAGSLGVDISYGLTTEKSAFDAHHRFFVGPSYTVSFPGDSHRWILFTTRLGYGRVETVKFKSVTSREIETEHFDVVKYGLNSALAFETELFYPLKSDATITFGARVYGKLDPNPWTVYIGYSKSISDLAKAILPSSTPSEDSAPVSKTPSAAPRGKTPKL